MPRPFQMKRFMKMATALEEGVSDNCSSSNKSYMDDDLADNPNDDQSSATSVVATSPSVDSVSSLLLAQLKLDEDFLLESKDLMVRVDNPEKHSSAIENYITFRVLTKTTRSNYDSHEYCVRRRYNDFMWLRNKIEEMNPSHLVPPLPEKHSMQRLSRFNADFVKTRMNALNRFLMRVAEHPVLSFDKNLQLFLVAKPFEFAAHKKEGPGILGRMTSTFHNLAATYMMKSRAPEFDQMNEYIQKLGEKLGSMERISQRINKEQTDHASELRDGHPVFTLWSSSENELSRALVSMASSMEKCGYAQQAVVDNFDAEFSQPLREYILYTEAIKDALKRRDAMQIEYELTVEELKNRKLEKEQAQLSNSQYSIGTLLGKDPDNIKKDKEDRIEQAIAILTQQAEINNDRLECANADLRSDFERWQATKHKDFKTMFTSMANNQIEFYQKCLSAWEEAIPMIRDTDIDFDA